MKVTRIQPNRVRRTPADRQQSQAPQGIVEATQGVIQGVGRGIDFANRLREDAAVAEARELQLEFERQQSDLLNNSDTGYLHTSGREGWETSPLIAKKLEESRTSFAGRATNNRAREYFNKVAEPQTLRALASVENHSRKSLQAWKEATAQAEAQARVDEAVHLFDQDAVEDPNSPTGRVSKLHEGLVRGLGAILDNFEEQGYSRDDQLVKDEVAKYTSSYIFSAFAGALDLGGYEQAVDFYQKYNGQMTGTDARNAAKMLEREEKIYNEKNKEDFVNQAAAFLADNYDPRGWEQEQAYVRENYPSDSWDKIYDATAKLRKQRKDARDLAEIDAIQAAHDLMVKPETIAAAKAAGKDVSRYVLDTYPELEKAMSEEGVLATLAAKDVPRNMEFFADLLQDDAALMAMENTDIIYGTGEPERTKLLERRKKLMEAEERGENVPELKMEQEWLRTHKEAVNSMKSIMFGHLKDKKTGQYPAEVELQWNNYLLSVDDSLSVVADEIRANGGKVIPKDRIQAVLFENAGPRFAQKTTWFGNPKSEKFESGLTPEGFAVSEMIATRRTLQQLGLPGTLDNVSAVNENIDFLNTIQTTRSKDPVAGELSVPDLEELIVRFKTDHGGRAPSFQETVDMAKRYREAQIRAAAGPARPVPAAGAVTGTIQRSN